jgi:hypothetical protein
MDEMYSSILLPFHKKLSLFFSISQGTKHFLKNKKNERHMDLYARDGIRTQELLRDQALNLTPLTWLGYPRACIDYL